MKEYERMKLIDYKKPALTQGIHRIRAVQQVSAPVLEQFETEESFYVTGRAYTLGADEVFQVSPAGEECGDFSHTLPFLVLEDKTLPWERKISPDMGEVPVPWMALIVLSSGEVLHEEDMSVEELLKGPTAGCFFPDKKTLPEAVLEKGGDMCHVVEVSRECYEAVMPGLEDMIWLTHVKKVNLADTEDEIAAKEGEFAVVMANRFVPTGEREPIKNRVHLVSMTGMAGGVPGGYERIRLVSLYHWDIYSSKEEGASFSRLIEGLKKNTGIIGCGSSGEFLQKGYVPKKHFTRSGEITYSLYRGPLIPYDNGESSIPHRAMADGYLIYDPRMGIFDVSYSAAFQMGRLIALSRKGIGGVMEQIRRSFKQDRHKKLLRGALPAVDLKEVCQSMVEELGEEDIAERER